MEDYLILYILKNLIVDEMFLYLFYKHFARLKARYTCVRLRIYACVYELKNQRQVSSAVLRMKIQEAECC